MASRVRIGVIGVGFGARVHIPAYQSEGLDVVAVCSRREERGREAAERYGIRHVYTDYERMARMDGLDAVSVVSPRLLHYPMAMAALEAGKHVLCEKPFTTDLDHARGLWNKAASTGVTAMLAHEFRFASARARVKELIDEGFIGPLHMALVSLVRDSGLRRHLAPFDAEDDVAAAGGGLLFGLGSHYVDCLRHWFGEVASVSGQVFTHVPERTHPDSEKVVQATADDAMELSVRFATGGWACMTGSYVSVAGPGSTIEVYGRDGTLVTPQGAGVNPPAHGTLLGAKAGQKQLEELPIPERLEPFADERDGRLMPMRLLVREFLRGIETGTSPSPNFYDGYRVQQVLHAVRESSATGQTVQIAPED